MTNSTAQKPQYRPVFGVTPGGVRYLKGFKMTTRDCRD